MKGVPGETKTQAQVDVGAASQPDASANIDEVLPSTHSEGEGGLVFVVIQCNLHMQMGFIVLLVS